MHLTSTIRSWRYAPADGRDLRIDLLRGFAVFAMAVDHVGGPSPLHALTGGNRFFVSAAEGFVALSGVTVGLVSSRRAPAETGWQASRRALQRAWTLYAIAVWMAVAFVLANSVLQMPKASAFNTDPARFVLDIVALRRTYYLLEVMLLYAFLMAVAPLAILALRRGWWWAVLAPSIALWAAYQVWPGHLNLPWAITDYRNFPLAPWQALFFVALVIGWHSGTIGRFMRRLPSPPLPAGWVLPLAAVLGVMIWWHVTDGAVFDGLRGPGYGAQLLDDWFDKVALPWPRLLACLLVFAFAWALASECWRPLSRATAWLLLPLGQSALYAYSAHVVAVCIAEALLLHLYGRVNTTGSVPGQALAAGLQVAAVAGIWLAVKRPGLQRAVRWLGSPPLARPAEVSRARPAASFSAMSALGVAAMLALVFEASIGAGSLGGSSASQAARRTSYNNDYVTTVTPPRKAAPEANAEPGQPVSVQQPLNDGQVRDETFYSPTLGKEMPYAVYLPAAYFTNPDEQFPVAYMLHGAGGTYTEWPSYGLTATAAAMMGSGEIVPFILIMPEGGRGYWVDGLTGDGEAWTTYVLDDLLPHVEATYRTLTAPAFRAIGGLSRGGFGALYLSFTHPDVFRAVAATSASLPSYGELEAPRIDADEFDAYDPLVLAEDLDPETAPQIRIDVGYSDDWRPAIEELDRVLTEKDIDHTFVESDGNHSPQYWSPHAPDYLRFFSEIFAAAERH